VYDQVARNKRRSIVIIVVFVVLVAAVLEAINLLLGGGIYFGIFALLLAGGSAALSYWKSDAIALRVSKAKPAPMEDYQRLHNIVEGLCIAGGLPKPRIYVVDDAAPNAFATGRDPKHAAIAVTTGLLERMNRVELEGVIAHELSHIKNYDILVSTLVVTMVGIIAIVTDVGVNMMFWSSRSNRKSNDNAGIASILALVGFVFLIFAPLIARVLQASVSRQRETLADISGVELTRFPPGLISALEKLRDDNTEVGSISHATAHLWIEQPQAIETSLGRKGKVNRMFDTHPPIEERIALLREL
jgi:heat shock protein HtpX